jgi:WD40 repeat protein
VRNDVMADGEAVGRAGPGRAGVESGRWRVRRARFALGNYRGIGLLVAMALFVPWLPMARWEPASHPSRRAPGLSRVPIVSLAFASDGRTLATSDERGFVTLWQDDGGWSPGPAIEDSGRARPITFSPDGRHLAIGRDEPGIVWCDLRGESHGRVIELPIRMANDLKVSPDGRTLAVAGADSPDVVLWDLDSGQQRMILRGHKAPVAHLAFAPDGRLLASAAGTVEDRAIRIWDTATGRLSGRITGPVSALLSLAYSPDGRRVAGACSHEKPVRIWDPATGDDLAVIAGHSLPTRSVAFSPDGRLLATASADGTAGVWGAATGQELRRLDGRAAVLRNVAFSPDGKTLAATGNDGDIRFWDLDDLLNGDRRDR